MSFYSQRDKRYLIDQFHYWLLIRYMKTLAMLKSQQFKDSESDETESKGSKCQHLDEYDNEEENGLDKDKSEIESARYISLSFILFLFS